MRRKLARVVLGVAIVCAAAVGLWASFAGLGIAPSAPQLWAAVLSLGLSPLTIGLAGLLIGSVIINAVLLREVLRERETLAVPAAWSPRTLDLLAQLLAQLPDSPDRILPATPRVSQAEPEESLLVPRSSDPIVREPLQISHYKSIGLGSQNPENKGKSQ